MWWRRQGKIMDKQTLRILLYHRLSKLQHRHWWMLDIVFTRNYSLSNFLSLSLLVEIYLFCGHSWCSYLFCPVGAISTKFLQLQYITARLYICLVNNKDKKRKFSISNCKVHLYNWKWSNIPFIYFDKWLGKCNL